MTHIQSCNQAQDAWEKWAKQWPDHCTTCRGHGEITYDDDPSAAGVSLGAGHMTFSDPCSACIESDRCPRCGTIFHNVIERAFDRLANMVWPLDRFLRHRLGLNTYGWNINGVPYTNALISWLRPKTKTGCSHCGWIDWQAQDLDSDPNGTPDYP